MSGIDRTTESFLSFIESMRNGMSADEAKQCVAEIRRLRAEILRLRAENKELRASYERVDRALRTVSGLHPARDQ